MADVPAVDGFFWQLCDPDATPGTTFREGSGFDALIDALRDLTAVEGETTPEGFIPSGNVQLYWSRVDRRAENSQESPS